MDGRAGPTAATPAGGAPSLRALVTAYLFPDRASLPGLYTAHVPKYVLRSPSDPYGASYRQLLARDVTARLRTLEAVFPGAERALNNRGVAAALDLYSRTYEAGLRRTFGQYFAAKAVDHVLGYLREACSPSGMERLVSRLAAAVARAGGAGEAGERAERPEALGASPAPRRREQPLDQDSAGVEDRTPLVRPLVGPLRA